MIGRRRNAEPSWIFAEETLSAVTHVECERLANLAQGATVLELGSYYGRSAIAMASTATSVHSVDPHNRGPAEAPRTLGAFLENLERHRVRNRVVVHVGLSTQILPLFRDGSFDLVFVDAMHQRPDVDVDVVMSARCLRGGGYLALHDYGRDGVYVGEEWLPFGVTQAVDEFVAATDIAAPQIVGTLAVVRAPSAGTAERDIWLAGITSFSPAAN